MKLTSFVCKLKYALAFKTWCDTQRNIALFTFITCQVTTSAGALLSTDLVGGSISRSAGPHTIHCLCRDFPPSSSLSRKCLPVNLSRILGAGRPTRAVLTRSLDQLFNQLPLNIAL